MANIIYLFIVAIASNLKYVQCATLHTFERDGSIDDNVCFGQDVVFNVTYSGTIEGSRCPWMCSKTTSCKSVFINLSSGQCIACNSTYSGTGNLIASIGNVYFASKTKFYGETCSTGDICFGTNQMCLRDTCICQIGYSYDKTTQTCVERCAVYGATFQKYGNWRLFGHNNYTAIDKSLSFCKNACIARGYCLSLEYDKRPNWSSCHVSMATPLSNPEALDAAQGSDLYIRNCA